MAAVLSQNQATAKKDVTNTELSFYAIYQYFPKSESCRKYPTDNS